MISREQTRKPMNRSRLWWALLALPLLCFALGASGKRSASGPRTSAKKMTKVQWTWASGTFKDQMASIDRQAADVESENKAALAQISRASTNLETDQKLLKDMTARGATSEIEAVQKKVDAGTAALSKQQSALANGRSLLSQSEAAKQQLQDATQGSESTYQDLLKGQINQVAGHYTQRAQLDQSARTEVVPGTKCGDYPAQWCAAPPDSRITFGGKWFLNRECVAYAAYKRWRAGKPFATGNAGNWPGNSRTPTVGSVAVWNIGTVGRYGHVAYVTGVSRDSITISEFNWHPWVHTNRTIRLGGRGWPSKFWN
ncbi:MAG: CHAP domain-containing protein [Elusimicrobia bacterium]|nr:CHAP domain-containing protein [Elusimicrobiota bacterium]